MRSKSVCTQPRRNDMLAPLELPDRRALCFFFQAEDGIRDHCVTGVQTCALPICMKCYVLENADGTPAAVHSIASGLDYPGVGPQHSYLKDLGRVQYESVTDKECLDADRKSTRLNSSHTVISYAVFCLKKKKMIGSHQSTTTTIES